VQYANDFADVILSLTRTSRVGYLRDIRRLTVALSRSRLGLYILGRREVFESCYELRQAFELLLQRPDKLTLVTGELWPSERVLADEIDKSVPGESVMEGAEHLGQYVFEMTKTKMEQLRAERGLVEEVPVKEALEPIGEEDSMALAKEDEDEDEESRPEAFEAEEEEAPDP
jgi:intron-binding protein aquarius